MTDFEYVEIDEFGLKTVKCMQCGVVVAKRIESASERFPGRTFTVLMHLPNWRQKQVELSNGTFMEPIYCADCVNKPTEEDAVMAQARMGWEKEDRHAGKPIEVINERKANAAKLKILKPAEAAIAKADRQKKVK